MKKMFFLLLVFSINFFAFNQSFAQCQSAKAVKTSHNYNHHKDVVDIAIQSEVHSTLVAALKAAGLVETLKGEGPFTIFAPTNIAFAKLPEGTVETLLQSANKASLSKILTYHVIAGNFSASDVIGAIKVNGGSASFKTVSGDMLKASLQGDTVVLEDEKGGRSAVTAVDLKGSNGVIHVIDSVVIPN